MMGNTSGVWAFSNDGIIELISSMLTITINIELLKQGIDVTDTQKQETIHRIESGIVQISKIIEKSSLAR